MGNRVKMYHALFMLGADIMQVQSAGAFPVRPFPLNDVIKYPIHPFDDDNELQGLIKPYPNCDHVNWSMWERLCHSQLHANRSKLALQTSCSEELCKCSVDTHHFHVCEASGTVIIAFSLIFLYSKFLEFTGYQDSISQPQSLSVIFYYVTVVTKHV